MRGRTTMLALVVAVAVYVQVSGEAGVRASLEGGAALLAAAAILWSVRRHRPPRPHAWVAFGLGWALTGIGRLLTTVGPAVAVGTTTQASLIDLPVLAGGAALVLGVVWFVADDSPGGLRESLTDAGVITLAGTLALWLLVMAETVHDPSLVGVDRVVALAYPITDLALLGTVVSLALAPRRRGPALWLVLGGLLALLVSQVATSAASAPGAPLGGTALQAVGFVSPLLVAVAAVRPDMGTVGFPSAAQDALSHGRLVALWLATLCSPMAFLGLAMTGGHVAPEHLGTDIMVAAVVTAVMLSLVLWRLAETVNRLGTTLIERDAASERELAVADIAAQLARAERSVEVREIVGSTSGLVADDAASVELWLPGDASDLGTDEEDVVAPYLLRHPLYRDPSLGMLVVRSQEPVGSGARSALSLVAGDVVLALERCRLAEELRHSEQRFRSLVQHAPDAITVQDPHGTITYASPAMGRILGVPEATLLGHTLHDLLHADDARDADVALHEHAADPHGMTLVERRLRRPDGGWRWIESRLTNLLDDPSVAGVVANHRDVTERKRLERQLEHQANHDALTGLANRRQLAQELTRADDDTHDAMVFIDLDRFKDVNDQLGHTVGDGLLTTIAARIGASVRPGDLAARLGGDEFAVLLRDTSDEQAGLIAARLLDTIREPMVIDGHDIETDASVGVAVAQPGDGRTSHDLLHESDVAMYVAKREGRGRVAAFSPEMATETLNRIELEAALRRALERQELRVLFQPVVDLTGGNTTGAEALLRWNHPVHGEIPPSEFVPVAERIGAIVPIGAWVLREACWQAKAMSTADRPLNIHVNVSTVQLREDDFVEEVAGVLAATGLDPRQLTLEITESVLVDGHPVTRASIDQLRASGVRLAIDDFGTGWSSLSYLRDVPVDVLKIDRSFVAGVGQGPEDAALARAILQLSHTFQLETVAEGIETEEQRRTLALRGCVHGQGYLFAPPLPAGELAARLDREDRAAATAAGDRRRRAERRVAPRPGEETGPHRTELAATLGSTGTTGLPG